MESPEIVKRMGRHPKRTVAQAAGVLIGVAEVVGALQNWNHHAPDGACRSPVARSAVYQSPDTSTFWQTYTGFGPPGVVAKGTVPGGAYGLEASFKHPDELDNMWDANASDMIKPDENGEFTFRLAIGEGAVRFGVRVVAPAGSPLCEEAPSVTYDYKNGPAYFDVKGVQPWPNPVNVLTGLAARVF